MRKKSAEIEEPKKKSTAAANHFQASHSMKPPEFTGPAGMAQNTLATNEQQAPQQAQETESEYNTGSQEAISEAPPHSATINPHKLFTSVKMGHNLFKQTSVLQNVSIQGSKAFGSPGCLSAMNVAGFILSDLSSELDSQENTKMAQAISKVLGRFMDQWADGFHVPGVGWFPMFDYFPGPVAPPMPNVPTPLSQTPSIYELYLTHKQNMIQEIFQELPSEMDTEINRSTVESFSEKTVNHFEGWLNGSFMINLLGMGPIPGFSPPFVIGGKVQNGQVLPKSSVFH